MLKNITTETKEAYLTGDSPTIEGFADYFKKALDTLFPNMIKKMALENQSNATYSDKMVANKEKNSSSKLVTVVMNGYEQHMSNEEIA
jgi:hypothetical protein